MLGFSDLQADIAAELIRRGAQVLITNQRTIEETYAAMTLVADALGEHEAGARLVGAMRAEMAALTATNTAKPGRPQVYFEEWDRPLISCIGWVSELIDACGGEDIFAELRSAGSAGGRIVAPDEVIHRDPDVIVASWCGKKARLERIAARPGWSDIAAVREGRLHEVKSPDILAPGLSLLHGARQLAAIIAAARA